MDKRLSSLIGVRHQTGALSLSVFGALDCSGAVNEAMRRIGMEGEADAFLRALNSADGPDWPEVPEWDIQIGDVVLSTGGQPDERHVSLVIQVTPGRRVISSAKKVGVYVTPFESIRGVIGIYRAPSQ